MRQYLTPDSIGIINCVRVRSIKTSTLQKIDSEFICTKCVFNSLPFECDYICSCRPACMANDPENVDKESIIFIMSTENMQS